MRSDLDRILNEEGLDAILMYSESFHNANMYYLTGFLAPDSFIYIKKADENPVMIVNNMEHPRAEKEAKIKDVRAYSEFNFLEVVKSVSDPKFGVVKYIAEVVKSELGVDSKIYVPPNFPAFVADVLRSENLSINPRFGVIEKARETKEPFEINEIREVQRVSERSLKRAIEIIKDSDVSSTGTLVVRENGKKTLLTAQKIKTFLAHLFLDGNCVAEDELIVACGPRSADPHYSGNPNDELKADQPIVLDLYPRNIKKRYWSDMTRTVVKGRASKEVKRMFDVVREAKDASIDLVKSGVAGSEAYNLCCDVLEKRGFKTSKGGKQISKGFTHSLGHGVGLQIHEGPSLSELSKAPLAVNNVVTVEPGLYDPNVGGMRIEDIVAVTKGGCENLTKMEVFLEI